MLFVSQYYISLSIHQLQYIDMAEHNINAALLARVLFLCVLMTGQAERS